MLSAFTARPIIELKQRDKTKIETILAYGNISSRTYQKTYFSDHGQQATASSSASTQAVCVFIV